MNKFTPSSQEEYQQLLEKYLENASEYLTKRLHFSIGTGEIRLMDERMIMTHVRACTELRRELVETMGMETARTIHYRFGYHCGSIDGEAVRKLSETDMVEAAFLGPRLHEMQGILSNENISFEIDIEKQHFEALHYWNNSWEGLAHKETLGISGEPACWMASGYASGFSCAFFGFPIEWREVECVAMGHSRCKVVGKAAHEWDDENDERPSTIGIHELPVTQAGSARGETVGSFLGISAGFIRAADLLDRVAQTETPVLFLGESGVGKECFAKALHNKSARADGPWVAVNCAAIPPDLVESELFGVERGAYTGAHESRVGRFERAHGGTLFLDELSSLPLSAQGKLLRVLQEREIERVGGTQVIKVDVRIISATNGDLRSGVAEGRFRPDLFYRVNVFPIDIPPLRERREDIALLARRFIEKSCAQSGKTITGLTGPAYAGLIDYFWPGNVRELENMIERAVILADDGESLDLRHLFSGGEEFDQSTYLVDRAGNLVPGNAEEDPQDDEILDSLIDDCEGFAGLEIRLLERAMQRSGNNLSAAARLLGLTRAQFEYRLKKAREDH